MFIEKKRVGKNIKFYLAHSYRENGIPRKIRKYLGANLSKKELEQKQKLAFKIVCKFISELNTDIFNFSLTPSQMSSLNKLDKEIKIVKLSKESLATFTKEFVYNTNAIEGSKLLMQDVKEVLDSNKKIHDFDELEAKGVARAMKYIQGTNEELSLELIKKLHFLCFNKTKAFAGKFRDVEVVVKNSLGEIVHQGILVKDLNFYLNDLISWYIKNKSKLKPLILAGIVHNQFELIHPFQDGNGRVGRLLLNFILFKNKYPPINIYTEDRQKYYSVLQEYQLYQNLKPTIEFLVGQYNKNLKKGGLHKIEK